MNSVITIVFFCSWLCAGQQLSEHKLARVNTELDHVQQMMKVHDQQIAYLLGQTQNLVEENKKLMEEIANVKKQSNAVVFGAYLLNDQVVVPGDTIVYDHVYINHGGNYDTATGIFNCPIHGLYAVFSVSFTIDQELCPQFKVQDDTGSTSNFTAAFVNDGHAHSATNAAMIECKTGGRIYVVNAWGQTATVIATGTESHQQTVYQSSFTGFLLSLL